LKCTAKVLAVTGYIARIQLNNRKLKEGDTITLRWGEPRSEDQNSFYWAYLTWLIDEGGMKDQGFFCPEALHESLKAHFLSEKILDKGQFKAITTGSTTDLTKDEFRDYFDKIDLFINGFFEIDTSAFHQEYQKYYSKY